MGEGRGEGADKGFPAILCVEKETLPFSFLPVAVSYREEFVSLGVLSPI